MEIDDPTSKITGNGTVSGAGIFQTQNGTFTGNGQQSPQQVAAIGLLHLQPCDDRNDIDKKTYGSQLTVAIKRLMLIALLVTSMYAPS